MSFLLCSLFTFTLYLAFILGRYGIQPSISDSYYNLPDRSKPIFTLVTWGYVLPLIFPAAIYGDTYQDVLFMFAATLLSLVGVMPNFKSVTERKWHVLGAEGGIALAYAWMLTTPLWFVAVPSLITTLALFIKKPRNHTYWIEVIAYGSVVGVLELLTCY